MDGILVLVLIGWLIKSMSSKKKGKSKAGHQAKRRPVSFASQPQADFSKKENLFQEIPQTSASPAEGEGSFQKIWTGSMDAHSSEGEDLCDPDLGHEREIILDSQSVYASEIGREPLVDLSAKGLLQGVIMSEILTRPTQRKRC